MNSTFNSTRRQLLQRSLAIGSGAALAPLLGRATNLHAMTTPITIFGETITDDVCITDDPRVKKLIQHGIDAARSAGASYVDIRLTHTRNRGLASSAAMINGRLQGGGGSSSINDSEEISIGVRALMNGYWGFASGPVWTLDEAARLGKEATRQASSNALGKVRDMILFPIGTPARGHWTTPIKIDPFTLHPSQIADVLGGLATYGALQPNAIEGQAGIGFQRQDKAFGSSDGAYFTQRQHITVPRCQVRLALPNGGETMATVEFLYAQGVGFEVFDEAKIRDAVEPAIAEAFFDASLPVIPVDVGKYETVLGATAVAQMLSGTIGSATQLDRALGYEANAGGTSYLNSPEEMLGSYMIGSPLLSVTVDRSIPGAAGTVKWDDEGIEPVPVNLITNGKLTGYQSGREGAGWLGTVRKDVSTVPCGGTYSAVGVTAPALYTGNLKMQPGKESLDFDSIVKTVKKGIACKSFFIAPDLDFQLSSGAAGGPFFQIANGKRVARLSGAAILFRTLELWKGVRAIGGIDSVRGLANTEVKGEPQQAGFHTAFTVPVLYEGLTYIDPMRKA